MGKTAFLFPGQGAQYVGMAQDFCAIPEAAAVFKRASGLLLIDMEELVFTDNDRLNQTEYTQPALLTAIAAILTQVNRTGIRPDVCAGLSLGEYAAMLECGVMSFDEMLPAVRKRGLLMEQAAPGIGKMAAVLGLSAEKIEDICDQVTAEENGCVSPANYNCPGQIVISGAAGAVDEAAARLTAAGAKRVLPLKVSGPFHSALLKKAGDELFEYLRHVEIKAPSIPYLANLTADYVTADSDIRKILAEQVYSPVKWQQTMEKMIQDGVDTFVEIGPGRTLAGFLRKIDRTVRVINIEKTEDLEKLDALRG